MSRRRRPNQPVFTDTKEAGTAGGMLHDQKFFESCVVPGRQPIGPARDLGVRSGIKPPIRIVACETRRNCRARTASTILRSRLKESPVTPANPPNILFIVVDDCGYADLGCTGQTDYATPVLDRLASEVVRFTQAYANAPLCTNTRVR